MKRMLVVSLVTLAACSGATETPRARPSPEGPPEVQADVAIKHAREFDVDLAARVAGSEQELAASTYILGTLQRAGYAVRLDPVPVGNLINSSNVMALSPSGAEPRYLVVVSYDVAREAERTQRSGRAVGLFLELARALRAADPDHDVGFVALGADNSKVDGGALGSRRLARYLKEVEQEPRIIRLLVSPGHGGKAYGPDEQRLTPLFCAESGLEEDECVITTELLTIRPDPLGDAGFDQTLVTVGDPGETGSVLLRFLTG